MPARLLVKHETAVTERPAAEIDEHRERPCWIDIADPKSGELEALADHLHLHPLAVEDALHRHQRPKIDEYDDHYFIVFYAIDIPSPDLIEYHEVSIFVVQNAIITVHEGDCHARRDVEKRFREGKLATTGLLLHALLDTMVDGYFKVVDEFADNVEVVEQFIVSETTDTKNTHGPLRELFVLKRDLLRLRQVVAPEREVLNVLVRGDLTQLRERGRRAYFQDVYDHIIRVTDEIDTFRELTSNVIDAYLAAASNRLNEVMKVLTSLATVLLVLTVVTGFFGQNWTFIPYGSLGLFWVAMIFTVAIAVGLGMYFKRRGWL